MMFARITGACAAMLLASGIAYSQGKPTDPQIAHIAYTAGVLDIEAAQQALQKSTNKDVRAFATNMEQDHKAVNDKALALVKKLGVTPEDNDTSKALTKQAADSARNSPSSAARLSTRPISTTRSPIIRSSTARWRPR